MSETENQRARIKGVFSSEKIAKVGAGATVRKTTQTMYWFAEEDDQGVITIQPLNPNYVPSGPKQEIPKEEFLEQYAPEPEFYSSKVYPSIRKLNQTIAKAERFRVNGETYSAEYEFGNALRVDEENIRANFGLGLTYLDRGETGKADNIFQRLIKMEATFEAEHKHLFNDFGISLRKNEMYEQATEYYSKALELSPADENLHYNMARACFAKADIQSTIEHLRTALRLNNNLEIAKKFLAYLKKNNLLPQDISAAEAKVSD
ncbi:Tfp pilus assembly protein PilF [Desulfomicrobium norvegicum]|uniref:Tfp pilus assembly protein PilF n=1 Tax=Desulfomicrobium norvegicum (strain DSM 1741 / NCIMB 8310) TaxID=52561 RepID=A0A8G2C1J3_DESNO|nr:tetratricopeptide repeat protein [Desulfomicrobium norvegicum]SFL51911.1 Tfp pilus assembly protein PilF [Desulfomicrobium norvegicum]